MRNPKRIPVVLKELEKTWKAMPDMRLGQLITNILGGDLDQWYVEDDETLKQIKAFRERK